LEPGCFSLPGDIPLLAKFLEVLTLFFNRVDLGIFWEDFPHLERMGAHPGLKGGGKNPFEMHWGKYPLLILGGGICVWGQTSRPLGGIPLFKRRKRVPPTHGG